MRKAARHAMLITMAPLFLLVTAYNALATLLFCLVVLIGTNPHRPVTSELKRPWELWAEAWRQQG